MSGEGVLPNQGNWVADEDARKASPKLTFEAYRAANLALIAAGGNPKELIEDLFQPLTNYTRKRLHDGSARELKPIVTLNDANAALDREIAELEAGIASNNPAYQFAGGVPELLKIHKEALNSALEVAPSRAA
jgi:hypothetical protein